MNEWMNRIFVQYIVMLCVNATAWLGCDPWEAPATNSQIDANYDNSCTAEKN